MKSYFYLIIIALSVMTQACITTGVKKDAGVEHVWRERQIRDFQPRMK